MFGSSTPPHLEGITPIRLPGAPWRPAANRFVATSTLADFTKVSYGEVVPLWPIEGWSHPQQRLWEAFNGAVTVSALLDAVRERCDDTDVHAAATLVQTIGFLAQPQPRRPKGSRTW